MNTVNDRRIMEQALVQSGNLAPIPGVLSFVDAAPMPVGGTTAVEAIVNNLKVQAGQKVFISGGSGTVGSGRTYPLEEVADAFTLVRRRTTSM